MIVSLVAAHARNRAIGLGGGMPWRLPADLARFKKLTMGAPVIMGRATFESIGRPLPGRFNIVMTRTPREGIPGALAYAGGPGEALAAAGDCPEVFVIGGGSVYRQFLDRADMLYITLVDAEIPGDTFFPEYDVSAYSVVSRERREPDERNRYALEFVTYRRKRAGSAGS